MSTRASIGGISLGLRAAACLGLALGILPSSGVARDRGDRVAMIEVVASRGAEVELGGFHATWEEGYVRLRGQVWRRHMGAGADTVRVEVVCRGVDGRAWAEPCVVCLGRDLPRGYCVWRTCRGVGLTRRVRVDVRIDGGRVSPVRVDVQVVPIRVAARISGKRSRGQI